MGIIITDSNDQNMIQFLGILTITNQYHGKYHNILGIVKYQYNGMIEGFWTLLNVWYIYLHDWVSLGHMLVYIYIFHTWSIWVWVTSLNITDGWVLTWLVVYLPLWKIWVRGWNIEPQHKIITSNIQTYTPWTPHFTIFLWESHPKFHGSSHHQPVT